MKRVSQENEKTSHTPPKKMQEPYQRNSLPVWAPRKILGTIPKRDEGRTLPNEPKNKRTRDDAWGFQPEDDIVKLYPSRKDISIQRLKDNKKSGEEDWF